ncbi:type IV conjugative transfer system coupling protein TraD [Vibrio mediterranei]
MSNATRGGQIVFHNIRMFIQIQKTLIKYGLWIALLLVILGAYLYAINGHQEDIINAWYYVKFNATLSLVPDTAATETIVYHGVPRTLPIAALAHSQALKAQWDRVWLVLQCLALAAFTVVFVIGTLVMRFFQRQGDEKTQDQFIRGMSVVTPKELEKNLKKNRQCSPFKLDGRRLFIDEFEVQHMLLDGTTGVGKSVALRQLLTWIRKKGDKAIIYDKGCTFVSKFYDSKRDVILNPFDARTAYWDVWCDGKTMTDFENQAAALIPQHGDGDPFWVQAARTIFATTAYKMFCETPDSCTTEKLLELILKSDLSLLSQFLQKTEANSLMDERGAKTAISVKSIIAAYIKSLRFLEGLGDPIPLKQTEQVKEWDENKQRHVVNTRPKTAHRRRFGIKDWVQNDKDNGFLFLSSQAERHASMRPLISMWLSIASTAILGMEDNPDRRIWIIIDEMPTLHKLPELPETIAEVRKFGGCYVLGIQSYAQLKKNYGQNAADELFDLLNTRLFYRSPSHPMAQLTSKELGEQEISQAREQYSYGAETIRDGVSIGRQTVTRPTVSPSEIMQLKNMQFWLRTPGDYPVTKVDLRFDAMPTIASPFIERTMPNTDIGQKLDELLILNQFIALNMLNDEDKATHLRCYQLDEEENGEDVKRHEQFERKAVRDKAQSQINAERKAREDHDKETQANTPEVDNSSPEARPPSPTKQRQDVDPELEQRREREQKEEETLEQDMRHNDEVATVEVDHGQDEHEVSI